MVTGKKVALMEELHVRPAKISDSELLFAWRNDPVTRSASLNTDEILWASHDAWFRASLASEKRHILMIESTSEGEADSIGMCRFDVSGETAEVSINLDPVVRGKGLALGALRCALTYFQIIDPRNTEIIARVREENEPSMRLFERAGFGRKSSDGDVAVFDFKRPETV